MTQNWPTPVDAGDYFRHEQKKVSIEQRRPVIRRASDLVGPGIAASAVRVTDWSDTLATFNGYYSSAPGAANAPTNAESFLGSTVMDADMGGSQTLTGVTSGAQYRRVFRRNPADPDSILWDVWMRSRDRTAATLESTGPVATTVATGGANVDLLMPSVEQIGDPAVYLVGTTRLHVLQPGVYTGHVILSDGIPLSSMIVTHPSLSGLVADTRINIAPYGFKTFPLTFATTASDQYVEVNVRVNDTEITDPNVSISITSLVLTRTSQID